MRKSGLIFIAVLLLGCRTHRVHVDFMVPVARVHSDGFEEGRKVIALLKKQGIEATPEREATVVFPILVPRKNAERALAILRTNEFVRLGKVQITDSVGGAYTGDFK